jgi:CBS domain-containing protein
MKTVNDILKTKGKNLWSVAPDSSVKNAIKLMADKQVDAMLVLQAGNLVGVISEKDCIKNVILKGRSAEDTQVWEIMECNMIYTSPGQTLEDCLEVMTEKHIRHLPVIEDGSLVGFFSTSDLIMSIITDQKDYINRLENYVMGIGFI